MAYCMNHPAVETHQACPSCGQPFCDACLVEYLGQQLCGPCRDARLRQLEGPAVTGAPLAGTSTVDLGGWLSSGWQLIQNDIPVFMGAALVASLIGLLSLGICAGAMSCGLLMMVYRKMTYGTVDFNTLFDGFKRFGWSLLLMLIIVGASCGVGMILGIPVGIIQATAGPDAAVTQIMNLVLNVISYAVGAIVAGATFFAMPHIAARNANPIDAINASFTVFRRNPLMFTLTAFVFQLVAQLGVCACCIGVLVTGPLVIAATAKAYSDHFGIEGWDAV